MKLEAKEAADLFIRDRFPESGIVFLSGSVVLGLETPKSDLDLVVLIENEDVPMHFTFYEYGWKIEAFVFSRKHIRAFFEESAKKGLPSLLRMCAYGLLIRDDGGGDEIRKLARSLLEKGPDPWSLDHMEQARYEITEMLEDLEGSDSREEGYYVAARLLYLTAEFILRTNERWIGEGKWMIRALEEYSPPICRQWTELLHAFYEKGEKEKLIEFVDGVLKPFGGRLVAGYYAEGILPENEKV